VIRLTTLAQAGAKGQDERRSACKKHALQFEVPRDRPWMKEFFMYIRRKRQSPKPKECSTALVIDYLDPESKGLSFALWRQIRGATHFNRLETIFSKKSQARNDAFRRPDRCETLGHTFALDSFMFVALILRRRSPRPGLTCPHKVPSAITRIILNKSCMRHPSRKDRDSQPYAVRLD